MKPFFSVIIPVKEIGYHIIFENLPHLKKQIYKQFEVILLPNEHTQYDLELLKKYKWLRIVPTGKITRPALKRNEGVKQAKGDIIAFIDDDAYPSERWLEKAAELFTTEKVAAVCGPGVLPHKVNYWEKVFDEVLKTRIGSGGYSYRFIPKRKRYVDDYPSMNFLVKKDIFLKLGGFNNDFWPGEDSKLCENIVYKEFAKILYHPDVLIYHHRRNNLKGFVKQHANYGYHRGAFFAHGDKNSRRLSYLIPTVFTIYLLILSVLDIMNLFIPIQSILLIAGVPFYIYLLFAASLFIQTFIHTKNLTITIGSVMILILTHIMYGLMFVKGYIKGLTHKENIYG